MRSIVYLFFSLGLAFGMLGQQSQQPEGDLVHVTAHVVEQKDCRGDADVFTVSFGLEVRIENLSKRPVHLLWPMVPWVGKVASNVADADAGRFMYEQTASHYLQDQTRFERITIEPGKHVSEKSRYYLVSKRDPALSLPKTVSAGKYAVVLVLSPEQEPPPQIQGPDTLKSITTEPFVVEVPTNPKLASCEAGPKAE